ncbi:General odorant-binding protein 71 [Eumeta japonica]|uniref:General odorant-binding protein 71 n=1 Tax=Eumeta variegata TaxID=151549 RepID=A0A4C1W7I4_EUMVA|nr:General odorant-binding protein 71 [Eumeta japonica]
MRLALALMVCTIVSECHGLKCRSDGGPRAEDMKTVYMDCLKRQEGRHNATGPRDQGPRRSQGRWREGEGGRGERDDSMDDDYGDMPKYKYGPMNQPSKRYKREKQRKEKNSGQRSQYNPNMSDKSDSGDNHRDDRNSSEKSMSASDRKKNCALHCFLEELDMRSHYSVAGLLGRNRILKGDRPDRERERERKSGPPELSITGQKTDENGMPDRYMVNHVLLKDVRSEDLKDFLQESIEECFKYYITVDRNPDKCEFSKNLMMCLSEKGRSNCDDWKDDIRF